MGTRAELAPGAGGEAEALREVVCLLGDELARARAEHEELRGRHEDPGTASDDRRPSALRAGGICPSCPALRGGGGPLEASAGMVICVTEQGQPLPPGAEDDANFLKSLRRFIYLKSQGGELGQR